VYQGVNVSRPSNVERGRRGEELAARALEAKGYTIVERNWRCPAGEIDVIAQQDDTLVFVEVKTRQGDRFGTPEEAVNRRKQERLLTAAQVYLAEYELADVAWRIDVIAINLAPSGRVQRLSHYVDAVRADG
jgi:putative endonuclease